MSCLLIVVCVLFIVCCLLFVSCWLLVVSYIGHMFTVVGCVLLTIAIIGCSYYCQRFEKQYTCKHIAYCQQCCRFWCHNVITHDVCRALAVKQLVIIISHKTSLATTYI